MTAGFCTDYTKTAGEIQPGWRVNMPHSYRELFVEAIFTVQGSRVLVVGLPSGEPYGGAGGLTAEEMDARRTYLEFRASDPVVVKY